MNQRYRKGIWIWGLASLLLVGCKSHGIRELKPEESPAHTTTEGENVFAPADMPLVLGHVVWCDAPSGRAVVYLSSSLLDLTRPLVARDATQQITGFLTPTSIREDKSLGVSIDYGAPQPGDEVLFADSDLPTLSH